MLKTLEKDVPGVKGLTYTAWTEDMLKKYGNITEEHIGKPMRLASSPQSKFHLLREIKKKGDKGWPYDGYIIDDPEYLGGKRVFADEIITFPKRKVKSNSQLSLRKKKTKKKKNETSDKI